MKRAGRPKKTPDLHLVPAEITAGMVEIAGEKLEAACTVPGKEDRLKALDELKALIVEGLKPKYEAEMGEEDFNNTINMGFDKLVQKTIRTAILEKGFRPDGRGIEDIRPLTAACSRSSTEQGSLPAAKHRRSSSPPSAVPAMRRKATASTMQIRPENSICTTISRTTRSVKSAESPVPADAKSDTETLRNVLSHR